MGDQGFVAGGLRPQVSATVQQTEGTAASYPSAGPGNTEDANAEFAGSQRSRLKDWCSISCLSIRIQTTGRCKHYLSFSPEGLKDSPSTIYSDFNYDFKPT